MKVSSTWAWWLMMAMIVAAASAWPTWTINSDSEKYSSLLEDLRELFGAGTPKVCNIPVTNTANSKSYVLVDLVFKGNTTTLAFQASSAYLVGYQDRNLTTNKLRANFFSDHYSDLNGTEKTIFRNNEVTAAPKPLPCGSSYVDLVSKSGVPRANVRLGVSSLITATKQVYGLDFATSKNAGKDVAKFGLVAISMLVEATRFKYIEGQVKDRGMTDSFEAGARITRLENNWSNLSKQYHNPARKCQPQDDRFTADEMKLGLLLYKEGSGLNSDDGHAFV